MTNDLFQAIADPTRREILKMISLRSLNIGSVAGNFDVSRTAVYKHIKILINCGLIKVKKRGRERYCEANFEKLKDISDWVEQYRIFWIENINSLEQYVEGFKSDRQRTKKKKRVNR
jgi:DNA-binding transcriptional ArsR family regulator